MATNKATTPSTLADVAHEQSHSIEDVQALLSAASKLIADTSEPEEQRWKVERLVRMASQRLTEVHSAFQPHI